MKSRSLEDRFWEKVHKTRKCWVWKGGKSRGYGKIWGGSRGLLGAHRVSWELHNGEIPEGMDVLHRCDNPACVRPDHLYLGTDSDNMIDAIMRGRAHPAHKPKLTAEQVMEIRSLYVPRLTYRDLANRYDVSEQTIMKIVRKRDLSSGIDSPK